MDIDKFAKSIANRDTTEMVEKVPFIKAKDVQAEMSEIQRSSEKPNKRGDALLRKVVTSLAKGRADDQKAVAKIAKEILDLGWYGPA